MYNFQYVDQCILEILVNQHNTERKFKYFSTIQILREINFTHFRISKSGRLYFFKALNSNFCKVAKNPQDGKFWVSEVVKSTLFFFFELLKSSKLISHKIQVVAEKYLNLRNVLGCIYLLNTRKYCDNTFKYCGNTYKYWANTWKICSPAAASVLLTDVQFQSNGLSQALKYIKIALKLTSIVTILASITLAGEHIFQVLAQYS